MAGDVTFGVRINADGSAAIVELDRTAAKVGEAGRAARKAGDDAAKGGMGWREMATGVALGTVAANAATWALAKLKGATDLVTNSIKDAARYETLGVAMENVGRNAGYSAREMGQLELGLRKAGISMLESRQNLTAMAAANLDLTKSVDLARAAQDAAVVAGLNSSEAFGRMIHGIISGQTEVLRTIGINVNFEKSYEAVAKATGRTTAALSENEKLLARQNVVLEQASKRAGTYAEAMTTAGKQLGSLDRQLEDLSVNMGLVFQPALYTGVAMFTRELSGANKELADMAAANKLFEIGKNLNLIAGRVMDFGYAFVLAGRLITQTLVTAAQQLGTFATGAVKMAATMMSNPLAAIAAGQQMVATMKEQGRGFVAELDYVLANKDRFYREAMAVNKLLDDARAERAAKADVRGVKPSDIPAAQTTLTTEEISAIRALANARAQAEAEIAKAAADEQEAELKASYDRRLLTHEEYYRALAIIRTREVDAEIASLQAQLKAVDVAMSAAQAKNDKGDTLALLAKRAELEGKLEIATRKRSAAEKLAVEGTRKQAEADMAAIESARQQTEALEEQAKMYGLTRVGVEEYTLAKLEAKAALLDAQMANSLEYEALTREAAILRELIDLSRRRVVAAKELASREQTSKGVQDTVQEWREGAGDIERALTDGLMRAFESGKGFGAAFKDTMVNLFNTMILRPMVQPIAQAGASIVNGLLWGGGASAAAGAAGGGGMAQGLIGTAAQSLLGGSLGFSLTGAGLMQGAGLAMGNIGAAGYFGGFGANMALAGSSLSAGSLGTAIGAAMPYLLPVILGAVALSSLFDDGPAMRAARFGPTEGATGLTPWHGSSRLGTFGFSEGEWLSEADQGEAMRGFIQSITSLDNLIASRFDPETVARMGQAVSTSTRYELGMEHEGTEGFDRIMRDRYSAALGTIDAGLGQLVANFEGTTEELLTFIGSAADLGATVLDLNGRMPDFVTSLGQMRDVSAEMLGDLATIGAYVAANPMEDVTNALNDSNASLMAQWGQMGADIRDLLASYDGGAEATARLAQLTRDRYALELQLANQINAALRSVAETTAANIRGMRYQTLDNEGKYNFLDAELADLFSQLETATDPTEIMRLFNMINRDTMDAFNLLDPAQQRELLTYFEGILGRAETLANAQLADAGTSLDAERNTDDPNSLASAINDAFKDVTPAMGTAANNMNSAAGTMQGAATTMADAAKAIAAVFTKGMTIRVEGGGTGTIITDSGG